MKLKINLVTALLFVTSLYAEKTITLKYPIKELPANYESSNNSYSNSNNKDNNIVSETLKNNFEMNSDETIFQKTINDRDKYNKMLNETLNLDYMMDVSTRPFKTIDTLYVHPNHITTIVLPEDLELKTGKSSFKTDLFELNENSILIKPNRDFSTGNIVITATNKKENYIMNIILKKIEKSIVSFDSDYNKYLIEDNYLSLIYKYERKNIVDKFEILQKYIKLNKISPNDLERIFSVEGSYDMMMFDGITYYIIRDERLGTLNYADINFRIDTKYSLGERSIKVKGVMNE